MSDIKKIIGALSDNDEKLLLSDVSNSFTVGDLKEMIWSAMLRERQKMNEYENAPLEDWQINDTKTWHFNEWLKNYC